MNKSLTLSDFGQMLGSLPPRAVKIVQQCDWRYSVLTGKEREAELSAILFRYHAGHFSKVVYGDKARWDKGWGENLAEYLRTGDGETLIPKYILRHAPMRLFGDLVRPVDPRFEFNWLRVYQEWLFEQFRPFDAIYEFGCGSAYNLALLHERYPEKTLVGLDWSQPAVDICTKLGIEGRRFDFFAPHDTEILPNSAVLTFGALEQTGGKAGAFVHWLKAKKPALVVFSEPIVEWYDKGNVQDALAIAINDKRNFLTGLPGMVKRLGGEVVRERRTGIGSILLEGYSQLWWKP